MVATALAPAAALGAPSTGRVSVSSAGAQGNEVSLNPSVSDGGRYVAFQSRAANLVAGDTNTRDDVFVRDRQTGVTQRVSVASGGGQSNGSSALPSITPDGRYVAFTSEASNLAPGDTNGVQDVFVHDRQTGLTASVTGGLGNGHSYSSGLPAISADGRYVVFQSLASDLVTGDMNGLVDVFVRDRQAASPELVSVDSAEVQANSDSRDGLSISADGRYVAFASDASNLVAGDNNINSDAFVRDRQAGTTERVSVGAGGAEGKNGGGGPSISASGRHVAFSSTSTNLVPGDTNAGPTGFGGTDVFVRDRQTASTERVSLTSTGAQANDSSGEASISADGSYVAFLSFATNLVPGDTNGWNEIFVRHRQTGSTERASVSNANGQANGQSLRPAISPDGRHVVFESEATNLVAGDTNRFYDVFIRADPQPPDAPAGFWRFGEPSGTVMNDSSPNDNDGMYLGGVTLGVPGALPGDPNTAASFDGINDSGRVPDDPTLDVGDSFTLEGWIKRSSTAKSHQLFNKGGGGLQLLVMPQASGNQVWLRKTNGSTIARSAIGVPADGRYHHVVATKSGPGDARIYVDGAQSTVQVSAEVVLNTAFPLLFGSAASTRASFDEFALYDNALSPGQVYDHFRRGGWRHPAVRCGGRGAATRGARGGPGAPSGGGSRRRGRPHAGGARARA